MDRVCCRPDQLHQAEHESEQEIYKMVYGPDESAPLPDDLEDWAGDGDLSREELEVALYSQVHYEPNHDTTVDYSTTLSTSADEVLVQQIENDDTEFTKVVKPDTKVRKVKKRKRDRNITSRDNTDDDGVKPKRSKVIVSSDDIEKNTKKCVSVVAPLTKFLTKLKQRTKDVLTKTSRKTRPKKPKKQREVETDSSDDVVITKVVKRPIYVLSDSSECSNEEWTWQDDLNKVDDLQVNINSYKSLSWQLDRTKDGDMKEVRQSKEGAGTKSVITTDTTLQDVLRELPPCDWSLSNEEYRSRDSMPGSRPLQRYYGKVRVVCSNCKEKGHLSKDCSQPKRTVRCILCGLAGHLSRSCPEAICYKCERPGHKTETCSAQRLRQDVHCHRCQTKGHISKECPEIWRQYHHTIQNGPLVARKPQENERKFCSSCAQKGHFNFECTRTLWMKKMSLVPGTHCSIPSPLVYNYIDPDNDKKKTHKTKPVHFSTQTKPKNNWTNRENTKSKEKRYDSSEKRMKANGKFQKTKNPKFSASVANISTSQKNTGKQMPSKKRRLESELPEDFPRNKDWQKTGKKMKTKKVRKNVDCEEAKVIQKPKKKLMKVLDKVRAKKKLQRSVHLTDGAFKVTVER